MYDIAIVGGSRRSEPCTAYREKFSVLLIDKRDLKTVPR